MCSSDLRIPAWADGASIAINGKRSAEVAVPGQFAVLRRAWKSGDHIELELPLKNRLEPLDPQHANPVALLAGPLVLFAITDGTPQITAKQLLSAKKVNAHRWKAEIGTASLTFLPFTSIEDEPYSTYLVVS